MGVGLIQAAPSANITYSIITVETPGGIGRIPAEGSVLGDVGRSLEGHNSEQLERGTVETIQTLL